MQRERITITLRPDVIAAVDGVVDGAALRNRSQAIEHLLEEGLGLHELGRAFLFFKDGWTQDQFETALALCAAGHVRTLYACLPAADQAAARDVATVAAAHPAGFDLQSVPADFGSGGCLTLRKAELDGPFLMLWVGETTALPDSLAGAYLFHRRHGAPVTEVLAAKEPGTYAFAGMAFGTPALVNAVPAGIASLEATVFPELAKAGNVRGYIVS